MKTYSTAANARRAAQQGLGKRAVEEVLEAAQALAGEPGRGPTINLH